MKYKNAQDILPDRLLRELQSYVSGEMLYVPNEDSKRQWGEASGARSYYKQRNEWKPPATSSGCFDRRPGGDISSVCRFHSENCLYCQIEKGSMKYM